MIKINSFNIKGEAQEPVQFKVAEKFLKPNEILIAQALRIEQNNLFGLHGETKTKGSISGGGKKPWRQKGTGRARAGSSRSPIWRGGGVTFGPTGEKRDLKIPAKMKWLAFAQLFTKKASEKGVVIIESIKIESGKTKDAAKVLEKITGRAAVITYSSEEKGDLVAWNNLPLLDSKQFSNLTLTDLFSNKLIILTKGSFEHIKERFVK